MTMWAIIRTGGSGLFTSHAQAHMNLLLIGPRGCGKTTIGSLIAASMKRPFIDLDAITLQSFGGMSVHEIWQSRGEAAWREAERAAFRQSASSDNQVIALGGGTPLIDAARQLIDAARQSNAAKVVYLRCAVNLLTTRLRAMPGDRPTLTGGDFINEIPKVLAIREPVYLAIADLVYDVNEESADDVAEGIIECLPGFK